MGRQFANDSMTPDPISVSRNQYKDEIPSDRQMHENSTPEHSNPAYTGRQYNTDVKPGTSVDAGGVSKESMSINVHKADRGRES